MSTTALSTLDVVTDQTASKSRQSPGVLVEEEGSASGNTSESSAPSSGRKVFQDDDETAQQILEGNYGPAYCYVCNVM